MTTKEKILTLIRDINYAYNDCTMYETIKNLLEEMEEKREKAGWIEDGYRNLPSVCSYCGNKGKRSWKYCPECGADMREEKTDGEG